MAQISRGGSLLWIENEHGGHECFQRRVFDVVAVSVRIAVLLHVVIKLLGVLWLRCEWVGTYANVKKDQAQRKDIGGNRVLLAIVLFWREIQRCPNDGLSVFFYFSGHAEICQHCLVSVYQHVLWLDVSVNYVLLMHVVNCRAQLANPFYYDWLTRQTSLGEPVEQIPALAVLHNNVMCPLIRKRAIEPHNVGVGSGLENGYLDVLCLRVRGRLQNHLLHGRDVRYQIASPVGAGP